MKIPLIKPFMNDSIKKRVLDVLDSGMYTEGSVTNAFEEKIKDIVGCNFALAVTSCTTGLELALRCLNIGPGDEVIVPDYTYPASADVVAIVGAKAIIVDVNPYTMLIDYDELKKNITPKTKAVIPVSIFGNPLDYNILNELKKEFGFFIIEDAACSLGSSFNGTMTGNLADISVFSHHPRKFITTGEGGTVTTNNKTWYDWMYVYKHFGITQSEDRKSTAFSMIGTNYKLSNILAAVGLGQLDYYHELLAKRQELAQNYVNIIKENSKHISLPKITEKGIHSYQSFCVFVEHRDEMIKKMRDHDIETQIGTYSLSMHKAFSENSLFVIKDCSQSRNIYNSVFTLPLYHDLDYDTQFDIITKLEELLNETN
jgi:dTDP-4-amino-4,6-dideoxygalactose transaminase